MKGRRWTDDVDAGHAIATEDVPNLLGDTFGLALDPSFTVADEQKPSEAAKRRVAVLAPIANLVLVECRVVVALGRLNAEVLRRVGLDYDLAPERTPSCPPG